MDSIIVKQIIKGKNEANPIINSFTLQELKNCPQIKSNNKEEFIEHPNCKNRNRKSKYRVSNFGNIEIREDNRTKYEPAEIINNDKIGNGWLVLKKHPSVYVYRLVAETWLEKDCSQKEDLGRWEVHHISNDGYDNRPENLIWLRNKLHTRDLH